MTTVNNLFKTYDKKNDNFMETSELGDALNQFAKQNGRKPLEKAQIDTIFKKYDNNKDKKISFEEFLKVTKECFNIVFAEGKSMKEYN